MTFMHFHVHHKKKYQLISIKKTQNKNRTKQNLTKYSIYLLKIKCTCMPNPCI